MKKLLLAVMFAAALGVDTIDGYSLWAQQKADGHWQVFWTAIC